jgi:hypothetical protein
MIVCFVDIGGIVDHHFSKVTMGGTQSLIVTCVLKQPQYTFLFIGSYYFRYEYALLSSF